MWLDALTVQHAVEVRRRLFDNERDRWCLKAHLMRRADHSQRQLSWAPIDSYGSIAPVRCQREQSLAGPRRRVADPLRVPPPPNVKIRDTQRTAAGGTGESQVSASADIRLQEPSDSNQSQAVTR